MKHLIKATVLTIAVALVLPAVAGCKTCEGGACALSAGETGKANCSSGKCGIKSNCGDCKGKASCKDMKNCKSKSACKSQSSCKVTGACKAESATLSTAALKTLLDAKTPLVLLDARTGKYDDGKRIPGAIQLSPDASPEAAEKVIPKKDSLVVTYCGNVKCPASAKLTEALKKQGYSNVLKYKAGIAAWTQAGHTVEEESK